jgi:outer membrane protein assembly factor BamB
MKDGGRLIAAATAYVAVALSGGVLACESLRTGAHPEGPVWTYRPSWSLNLVYAKEVVAPSRVRGEPYERGQPEIDAVGRRVFVGSSDGGLYALDAADGSLIWRFEALGPVQCAPLFEPAADAVYFGSNDGALYKVRAADGRLLWRFSSNAEVSRRPVLYQGLLYVVNANDTVMALDPDSGRLRWSQHRAPAQGMEVAGYAGPLVWNQKVYVGFSDGSVVAYDARTGEERWQPVDLSAEAEQLLGEVPQYLDVDTTPVGDVLDVGPAVFVGSYEAGLYALDADTGTPIWSNPAVAGATDLLLWEEPAHAPRSGKGPLIAARKLLITATGTTGLWAIDPATGREVWHRQLPEGGVSGPVPFQGALLVSASRLGLFLVSPIGGKVIDGLHTGDGATMAPATLGNRAFVVTNGGKLLSLVTESPLSVPTRGTQPRF